MKWLFLAVSIVLIICIYGCAKEDKETPMTVQPSEVFISRVINCMKHSEDILDDMVTAADAAAERVVKGGKIYVMDDQTIFKTGKEKVKTMPGGGYEYPMHEDWGGFVAEACDRAGGLRHIQPVPLKGELSEEDIVIVGTLELHPDDQFKQLMVYKDLRALIIVFGSRNSKIASLADYLIDNDLESGTVPVMNVGGSELIGSIAGIANIINMWTFTAEFVAAVTRQGEMPALWQSMFVQGAAQRNKRIGEFMFHPYLRIMPIEPKTLGLQYITKVKGFLVKIMSNELTKFREAGKLCAETISMGNTVVEGVIGHFMSSQRRMPGFPQNLFTIIENEYGIEQLKKGNLGRNDVWLHIGYSMYPERELKYAQEVGAKTICVFTPGPTDIGEGLPVEADMNLLDIYIDPYWKHGDAIVEVPDYDTKIIPPSGVVMVTCYWMIIGETMAQLAELLQ